MKLKLITEILYGLIKQMLTFSTESTDEIFIPQATSIFYFVLVTIIRINWIIILYLIINQVLKWDFYKEITHLILYFSITVWLSTHKGYFWERSLV